MMMMMITECTNCTKTTCHKFHSRIKAKDKDRSVKKQRTCEWAMGRVWYVLCWVLAADKCDPTTLNTQIIYSQHVRTVINKSIMQLVINFQSKVFSITAPAVWNSLSPATKSSATITTFKSENWTVLCCIRHGLFFCRRHLRIELSTYSTYCATYKCFFTFDILVTLH